MRRIVSSLIVAFSILELAVSCAGDNGGSPALEVSKEISAHDPIVVRTPEELPFIASASSEALAKAVSISPKVDFEVEMAGPVTLCIYPKTSFAYNTTYKVTLNVSKLVPSGKGKTTASVRTLAPIVDVTAGHLSPVADNLYSLKLSFDSNDVLDAKILEDGFKAKGAFSKAVWSHSEDGLSHSVVINDIKSQNRQSTIEVSYAWSQYALSGEKTWQIPAEGEFCVIESEFVGEPLHYELVFSSALAEGQDFSSLVSMPSAGKLRFTLEDNVLKIYPSSEAAQKQFIVVSKGIKSSKGAKMEEDFERYFVIPPMEPTVAFISSGVILPSSNGAKLYFESKDYAKVQVRVHRIYESNVLQFLQSNRLNDADTYIGDVARCVADTTFALAEASSPKLRSRNTYGVDLSQIVDVQRGAVYKVEIRGREPLSELPEDYYESDYWFGSYRDYSSRTRNVLVSDLGIIAKGSDRGVYRFFVADIVTAAPVRGAAVKVYNSVNQIVASGTTDGQGCFECVISDDSPRTVIVSSGKDCSYMSLAAGSSISMSNFDVDGTSSQGGQKGFIFGERGVWRPGDKIHITFISMLDEGVLPDNHPASAVLRNPQGQIMQTKVAATGSTGVYSFEFSTEPSAPTGNYEVEVTCGGASFTKRVKVETVKPNNIVIDLSFGDAAVLPAKGLTGNVKAKWLVGLPASDLETRVEVALSKAPTTFDKYKGYAFEDNSRIFESQTKEIFKGRTGGNGDLSFTANAAADAAAPGFLSAAFTTRVFEKSGDFSIDRIVKTVSPYDTYLGINVPEAENRWGEKYLDRAKVHKFPLVALSKDGSPVSGTVRAEVEVYKMGWSWWWSSAETLAYYSKDSYNSPFKDFYTEIKGGEGSFNLDFSSEESGFYFVRVSDTKGGHAASAVFMVSDENEYGNNGAAESAAKLQITIDKEKYTAGETALLRVPSTSGAKILVSLEKGDRVLKSYWVDALDSSTEIPVKTDATMAPDIYAVLTLVQPHSSTKNDAPIRLFGVQRICVEDNSTHLEPVIDVADKIKPESEAVITVKEKNGKAMSYVLAVVDEGLLSLTRFKTPDPWKAFYATEALSVRTWDLYDMVVGAYGARMEQMFAIGGDAENELVNPSSQAERFTPVALFYGPFSLKAKGSEKHKIDMPQYIGNVRVMVIASDGRAMGSAQKNVSVTKPLMVQATLPRVFGTDDEATVPVTVFATEDNIGKVTVTLNAGGQLAVDGSQTQSVDLGKAGEYVVNFRVKASSDEGIGKIDVSASCSKDSSKQSLEVDVREPNTPVTTSVVKLIPAGKEEKIDYTPLESEVTVESSSIPPVDLDYRLSYLTSYPHGCLEQTVSGAFPQLYLSSLVDKDDERVGKCQGNVEAAIAALPSFAISGGGMTYWPGTATYAGASVWASIYATHFMVEAEGKGYAVPSSLKRANISYLKNVAASRSYEAVERAYACYVLALSGSSARSEMNRLREDVQSISSEAQWLLAAAYAVDGKKDVAKDILGIASKSKYGSGKFSPTFSSEERAVAIAAETYRLTGERNQAFQCVKELSENLSKRDHYMSTQSVAWALDAVASYVAAYGSDKMDVSVTAGGRTVSLKSAGAAASERVSAAASPLSLTVRNNAKSDAYFVVSSRGVPAKGQETTFSNGLSLDVRYTLADGTPVDPSSLAQGTDFVATVYVSNTSANQDYTNLALSEVFPAGWEIRSERGTDMYQDIRDDRIYSYFDLPRGASVTVKTRLTATYSGRFYMPATVCEAMYEGAVAASVAGGWCEVK